MKKIEIPQSPYLDVNWKPLVEQWNWGYLGELLRQGIEREMCHGTAV